MVNKKLVLCDMIYEPVNHKLIKLLLIGLEDAQEPTDLD